MKYLVIVHYRDGSYGYPKEANTLEEALKKIKLMVVSGSDVQTASILVEAFSVNQDEFLHIQVT